MNVVSHIVGKNASDLPFRCRVDERIVILDVARLRFLPAAARYFTIKCLSFLRSTSAKMTDKKVVVPLPALSLPKGWQK